MVRQWMTLPDSVAVFTEDYRGRLRACLDVRTEFVYGRGVSPGASFMPPRMYLILVDMS